MKYLILVAALFVASCITVKFQPLPVVLSWGGVTVDPLPKPVSIPNPKAIRNLDAGIPEVK